MSSPAALTDVTLEKLQKLTSSFAILALAMKQSSDEFKSAALEFSKTMEAVRAMPAFVPPLPIDTATPAAEKAATALSVPPPIDTATPAAQKAAAAIAVEERNAHFQAMEQRRQEYCEQYKNNFNYDRMHKHHRMIDYQEGCIRVIDGRRALIYKYHAFEMPNDHPYHIPGPLVSIGTIDPDSKVINPDMLPPELPTTAGSWPWR